MAAKPASRPAPRQHAARGVAALTVVMVLFFIMALVAAYTNRNLVFEQRISANSYRLSRAADAAEAGLDWAVALLNGGRINDLCVPSDVVTDLDFRRRYLVDSTDESNGAGGYSLISNNLTFPACIINSTGALNCICPTLANRNPGMVTPADGVGTAFRLNFRLPAGDVRPGSVSVSARGCASPGEGGTACHIQSGAEVSVDAKAGGQVTLGLLRALPFLPVATVTAGRNILANGGVLTVVNGHANTGLTAHAGGLAQANAPGTAVFAGPAGSGSNGLLANDASLSDLVTVAALADDRWFKLMFALDRVNYARQPAVISLDCALVPCDSASLVATLARYPRHPIWINGNLSITAADDLGSATEPVLLIVTGDFTVAAAIQIFGFVHANNIVWGAAASLQGAMAAANDFTSTANATLVYRRDVLDIIRLRYGSFVRVPGSWKLLTTGL